MTDKTGTYGAELITEHIYKHSKNIQDALKAHGVVVTKALKTNILSSVGTGIKHPNLPNRSSAPGETPVSQSGLLANSFGAQSAPLYLNIFNTADNNGAPYPLFLEEDSMNRPYFISTIEPLQIQLERDLGDLNL